MIRTRGSTRAAILLLGALAVLLPAAPLAAQQAVPLERGETVEGTLAAGDTARFTVQAGADFFLRGVVDQRTVDVAVRVVDPRGEQVARVDGPARGAERFQVELEEAGGWEIQVIPFAEEGEDAAGAFAITVERLEPLATDPEELAEQLLSAYSGNDSPGAAVQVWRDGRTLYSEAWGMANLAYGVPFETDTPTNIGSTSKQFTAFAVELLAHRGQLSLDDPVTKHVPEIPEFEDTVRVRHLLTHTSGYREVYNLLLMTGRRIGEGDYVSRDEILTAVQNQPALQNAPGAEFNYNNTAFALAALVVERVSGQDFPEFMEENVFGPLGMERTGVRPHAEDVIPGRSMGYAPDADGGYREIRDLGGAVGAGAIYSTVEDLQLWAENYASPRVGNPTLVEEMTTSFVTTEGDTTGYGYGLFLDEQRGLRRVHHGGADIAHRSMLAMYPDIGAGITVQSNHAGFDSGVAFRLAEAFFEDAMEPEEAEAVAEGGAFDPESYDPEDFDRWAGRYALEAAPAFVITLSRDGDALHLQATGQPQVPLTPTSDSTFDLRGVEASVTLHADGEGGAEALTLHQGGAEQRATRIEGESWAPTAEELESYAGRYLAREIETFYELSVEADDDGEPGLVLRQRRLGEMRLTPGDRDEFSAAAAGFPLQLAFERDRNDQVIGFYLGNGRTRDVRFERMP